MRLSVEGYKSISKKISININGLTIISGANSSGKSSFMQPFLVLKQTIENNSDTKSLLISGENVDLTEKNQIFCKHHKKKQFSIYMELSSKRNQSEESEVVFDYNPKQGFTAKKSALYTDKTQLILTRNMPQSAIAKMIAKLLSYDETFKRVYTNFSSDNELKSTISNDKPFLSLKTHLKNFADDDSREFSFGFSPNVKIERFAENIIHIPGIRSIPERQYRLERYSTKFQGRFDKYMASVIYTWCEKDAEKLEELISLITKLELASNITATKINEAHIAIEISRYMKSNLTDTVNLSDVGFGLSQVLPILVALIVSKKTNIIYIEQPELHLHPKAQYILAQIICDYIKAGKKVIVETHSSIFIRAIQTEVAEDNLSHTLFSLNWFSQNNQGETIVSEATLDTHGAFGAWPANFDDVYLEADDRYLNAIEKKLMGNT